jgi:hypothetical protein
MPVANDVESVAAATRPTETRTWAPSASGPTTYFASGIETLRIAGRTKSVRSLGLVGC